MRFAEGIFHLCAGITPLPHQSYAVRPPCLVIHPLQYELVCCNKAATKHTPESSTGEPSVTVRVSGVCCGGSFVTTHPTSSPDIMDALLPGPDAQEQL